MPLDRSYAPLCWTLSAVVLWSTGCDTTDSAATPSATSDRPERGVDETGPSAKQPVAAKVPRDLSAVCEQLCGIASELRCENDDADTCERDCLAMARPPVCEAPMQAFLRCAVQQPADRWQCDSDQESALRAGACELEQETVAGCFERRFGS